ncbi:MAG: dephospho-CoA kinase [Phycisphaerae bacterium]|nr:dephospho-CoA kinase [Phycisphaerae bacterium]
MNQPVIGICGGIGAGKSAVAAAFAERGCLVISSDRLSHEVMESPDVSRQLAGWWGNEVIDADGRPNRQRIAEIVFRDGAQKQRLEALLYPLIAQRRSAMILSVAGQPAVKAIVLDSPLLFESRLDRLCDAIVFVDSSRSVRLSRIQQSRQWDDAELSRREAWQLPVEEKRARSDYQLVNEGSIGETGAQVDTILARILAEHAAGRSRRSRE